MSYEEEDTCVAYELTRYACLRIGACAIKTGTGGLMTPKDMTHMYPPPHMTHMYPPPHMTHTYPRTGGLMTPKDMIGAGLAKFKNARDDSSSGGGDSDAWSDSD